MNWTDIFWKTCKWVLNTGVDMALHTTDALGTMACFAGGGLIAAADALHAVNVSYYGGAMGSGMVRLNVSVPEIDYQFQETIPVSDKIEQSGSLSFDVKDYVRPDSLSFFGYVSITAGLLLRASAAQITYWRNDRAYGRFFYAQNQIEASRASLDEHLLVSAGSVSRSISFAAVGYLSSRVATQFVTEKAAKQTLSYPPSAEADGWEDTHHYVGPVKSENFFLRYAFDKNQTIQLPIIHTPITLDEKVLALINATIKYGGRLLLREEKITDPSLAASITTGASTLLLSGIFAKHRDRMLLERRFADCKKMEEGEYVNIQGDSPV